MDVQQLRARADRLTIADRSALLRRIGGAARIGVGSRRQSALDEIVPDLERAERRVDARRAAVPRRLTYPDELPIVARRRELLTAIAQNQVVIVSGATGSGKSTQLPKLCLELGRGVEGLIGHTQPRRIAARTIAARIADETGTELGGLVGYAVRFTDHVADDTLVKVMTDGLLLSEIQRDRMLSRYDTVIVDEAHERSLNIDFLLGYLARLLPRRPDLKVIVTSATIDTPRFSAHFGGAPIVEVSGRTHPVEIRYRPMTDRAGESVDQPDAICGAVAELVEEGPGDVLVFCSGEREIRDAAGALADMRLPQTEILPLYARLSVSEQQRVFRPHPGRRIVLATNVAETSLTVPGIRYVVDPGTARISRYSRRTRVQRLPIEPISRASADQRAGRCGRLGPGICIRLYSEDDYLGRPAFTEPEVVRTNLASVILQMAAAGLGDVEWFPFLDAPDRRAVRDGLALLEELDAIEQLEPLRLTTTGKALARLPVDPRIGRMLTEADRQGCLAEVLVIASGLSIIDPRERPSGDESKADVLHARFEEAGSDLLGWLSLWDHLRRERSARTSNQFRRMCRDEYLNHRRVREWQDVHHQLRQVCAELGMRHGGRRADSDSIHRALLAGLLSHVGRRDTDGRDYRGARGVRFSIAPGSALFRGSAEWVMAADLVETTRLWARGVAAIDPAWIEDVGAHLVRRSHSDPWWDATRGSAIAAETVTLYGIPLVAGRPVLVGSIDAGVAREMFVRNALVAGEWDTRHAFARRNAALFQDVEAMEARARRDLRADDDALYSFFDARVPDDVISVGHFDAWWRNVVDRDPGRLDLALHDVLAPGAVLPDDDAFPEAWHHGDVVLPIHYAFEPGASYDGVVVDVPVEALDRLDPAVFDWHVPGHREELVEALIRSLPKRIRTLFVPVKETAVRVLEAPSAGGGLLDHVRRELTRIGGESIVADDFDLGRLPPHLTPIFRVVGIDGTILSAGEDLAALRQDLRSEARRVAGTHPIERAGLTVWDVGRLPRSVRIGRPPAEVTAYPALVDDGESVSIRLLATSDEQAEAMWFGTRRLAVLALGSAGPILEPLLSPQARADLGLGPYPSSSEWMEDCVECAVDAVLRRSGGPVWDAAAFDRLVARIRDDMADDLERIARSSLGVFAALRDLQIAVNAATAPMFADAVSDIRAQVGRLVYSGFLAAIGPERIADVARYLRAMAWRLERMGERLDRDRDQMAVVHRLEAEYERLVDSLGSNARLVDVGWMLQELRVSYFAQPLGAKGPVSAKRLATALREAELA